MSTYSMSSSTADNPMMQSVPNNNYDTNQCLYAASTLNAVTRSILSFYLNIDGPGGLPSNAIISSATLSLYALGVLASRTITAYRVLRTDWSSPQSTWNNYKTGYLWATAGAKNTTSDITTTDAATSASLSTVGWQSWDITNQAKTAKAIGTIYVLIADDGSAVSGGQTYAAKEYTTDTSKQPHLTIEYTVPSIKTVNGLAKASVKTLRSGLLIASGKTWDGLV